MSCMPASMGCDTFLSGKRALYFFSFTGLRFFSALTIQPDPALDDGICGSLVVLKESAVFKIFTWFAHMLFLLGEESYKYFYVLVQERDFMGKTGTACYNYYSESRDCQQQRSKKRKGCSLYNINQFPMQFLMHHQVRTICVS